MKDFEDNEFNINLNRILGFIERIWHTYPELRLSQLILNISKNNEDIYILYQMKNYIKD